jgi:cyclopropane fatty-acyl-phospholipid synthase-like methyltransferase
VDPALLQAWGVRSVESVPIWVERLFPALDGLCEALKAPTASFLDVGTGVGRLAIAMCEQFPTLRVVGLDPFDAALKLARRNVAEAALEDRIELRPELVQDLADEECYDLAWVPVMFLPAGVAARGLHRVRAALRPGGWVILGTIAAEGDGLQPAVQRLVALLFGSGRLFADHAAEMLRAAAYEPIQILPAAPGVPIRMIVGRRPSPEST